MSNYRYAVEAFATEQKPSTEFARSMTPHPLGYLEIPYDPEYMLYNDRLNMAQLNHQVHRFHHDAAEMTHY